MQSRGQSDIRARFGLAVRRRRLEIGISQEELAERSGLHRTYVGDIERGLRNVSLVNIEKLAKGLGISLSKLIALCEVESSGGRAD